LLSGVRPGLERVRRALDVLGHPEESFASVLVGGTNGKGSVSSLLSSVLRTAGFRTGLFTSPHLVSVRERVQVNGVSITPRSWAKAQEKIASLERWKIKLTEFEVHALVAFLEFERAGVDIAVLEVGLGGRLDAVNVVSAPEISVITSIGLDHTDWLGPTRRHIYHEKRGIARPGSPLIQSVPSSLEAESRRFSLDTGVSLWTLGRDILVTKSERIFPGQRFTVTLPDAVYEKVCVPFWGDHQVRNGALAVAVLHRLSRQGWSISKNDLTRGMARARWPGRFQVVSRRPPVVLDGAHNPDAARALRKAWLSSPWGSQKVTLIFGCLKDKDVRGVIRELSPVVERVVVTGLPSSRACPPEHLASFWEKKVPVRVAENFEKAWTFVQNEKRTPTLITGSLYLVGEAIDKDIT